MLRIILVLFICQASIYSDEVFDFQFYNPKVKIINKDKQIFNKKEFLNPYITEKRIFDSRFKNISVKERGIDITKKNLILEKNASISFEIASKLNHRLELVEFSKEILSKKLNSPNLKIYLNEVEVKKEIISSKEINFLRFESLEKKVELEKLRLIPFENKKDTPDILFIVIDSLRADVVGFNGAKFSVTPNLDSFSKVSTNYQNHFVNSSWTRPSTYIFFTGLYASKHFLNFWDYTVFPNEVKSFYNSKISVLPEFLSAKGFETFMIGNNPFLTEHRNIGADTGFHSVYDFSNLENDTIPISNKAQEFYRNMKPKENRTPVFLFLNFNDPHKPYTPTNEFLKKVKNAEQITTQMREYLGEVSFVDSEIEKIFSTLKEKNLFDNTIIIITSDHGEVMNPKHAKSVFNGVYTLYGHGQGLYDEDVHTPLLIKYPFQKKEKKISNQTRSIDLFPTVVDFLKLKDKIKFDGISLIGIEKEKEERIYYGESRGVIGIRKNNMKWLQKVFGFHRKGKHWKGNVEEETSWLFDLKKDPSEINSIDDEKLKSYFTNFAHDYWKKKSMFGVRISNFNTKKKIKFQSKMNIGKSLLCDENGKPIQDIQIIQNKKGFSFEKIMGENETKEFYFLPYPEVDFPNFDITVDDKKIDMKDFGVGEKDLSPLKCKSNDECSKLYLSNHRKPAKPKKFRIQIWFESDVNSYKNENLELGKEAIDILKKQGYIQ